MNIAVLVKVLPDDQDIAVNPDRSLDFSRAKNVISTYDLNAIEAAAQLAEKTGSTLTAISVGPKYIDNSKTRKNILSRGVDTLHVLADDAFDMADSHQTAAAIAKIIEKLGNIDLVICGDGSADQYAQQVDVQLAELLGWPSVNAVVKFEQNGSEVVASRVLESESEQVTVPLPAVISVSPDIALPRIAGMKDILAAGKKPVTSYGLSDIDGMAEASVETMSIKAPEPMPRQKIVYSAANDDGIDNFVSALREAL